MNCNECLAALETESLREMTPDSPVLQHCVTCPDCARLTTLLRDKEYETATILNSLPPMSNPLTVADYAVSTAKRRRLGRVAVVISGAALAVTIFLVAMTVVIPAFQDDGGRAPRLSTETIALTGLSPQQAGDIIEPYIQGQRSRYFTPASGISTITVRGTPAELATSRELIRKFEDDPGAACRLPMTIINRVRDQITRGQGVQPNPNPNPYPNPNPDKATTSLLGKSGGGLLDPRTPPGTEPAIPAPKATTPPKK